MGFVHRPEYYLGARLEQQTGETAEKHANRLTVWKRDRERLKGKAEVGFAKVREGVCGAVELKTHGETTSFAEPSNEELARASKTWGREQEQTIMAIIARERGRPGGMLWR